MRYKTYSFSFIIIFFLFLPRINFAQESDLGNWIVYLGNKKIKEKWTLHQSFQYRTYDAFSDLEQILVRIGMGYDLSPKNNNVLLGYDYILTKAYSDQSEDKISTNDHIIFEQFLTKQKFRFASLTHRYRFEQIFRGDQFKLKFRYLLGINIPLLYLNDRKNNIYLSSYNEIFIHTKGNAFDRHRLYAGLGYKFSKAFSLELGWMNQFLSKGERDQVNVFIISNF